MVDPASVVAVVLFFVWRAAEIFRVSVRDGRVLVIRGRVPPRCCARSARSSGRSPRSRTARSAPSRGEHGARLTASGAIDEGRLQRLRNAFALFPTSKLRAAAAVARPTLGQVLGIAWLAWLLDRGRDIEDSQQTSSPGRSDLIEVFYFFYYQSVGVYMTFLPAYLRGLGLSGREISTVFAVSPLLALVVPLAWAYLADRTHRHDRVLRVVVGGAWLGFVPMLFARSFTAILVELGAVRAVRGRGGRPGRRLRGRARARRRRVRAPAPVGLRRLRRRLGGGRRAAVRARPRGGSAGADRDVAGARLRVSRRRCGCAARASRPRARAPPTCKALLADPRLRMLLVIAALHWICLDAVQRLLRRLPARPRPAAAVVGPRLLDRRRDGGVRPDDVPPAAGALPPGDAAGGGVRRQRRALARDRGPSARPGR